MSRPRLLFLCHTLQFPPDGGFNMRSYHVMRILASVFEIKARCFFGRRDRPEEHAVERAIGGVRPFAAV